MEVIWDGFAISRLRLHHPVFSQDPKVFGSGEHMK